MEVCEGETKEEKIRRTKSEQSMKNMKKQTKMKKILSDTAIEKKKTVNQSKVVDSVKKQLEKLTQQYNDLDKLTDDLSIVKKNKIKDKIERIKIIIGNK